jgi:hypothetical protein
MVYGTIKGTPSGGSNSIDPALIAQEYWRLYQTRSETRHRYPPLKTTIGG